MKIKLKILSILRKGEGYLLRMHLLHNLLLLLQSLFNDFILSIQLRKQRLGLLVTIFLIT